MMEQVPGTCSVVAGANTSDYYVPLNGQDVERRPSKVHLAVALSLLLAGCGLLVLHLPLTGEARVHGDADTLAAFATPTPVLGECSAIWTNHWYKYTMPYAVHWSKNGLFNWTAPFKDPSKGFERGRGTIMGTPTIRSYADGSWTAAYHAATSFLPDGNTTCTCEYLTGKSSGEIVYTDYLRANIQGRVADSVWDVCGPYLSKPCPADNASAFVAIGTPFVEVYSSCKDPLPGSVLL